MLSFCVKYKICWSEVCVDYECCQYLGFGMLSYSNDCANCGLYTFCKLQNMAWHGCPTCFAWFKAHEVAWQDLAGIWTCALVNVCSCTVRIHCRRCEATAWIDCVFAPLCHGIITMNVSEFCDAVLNTLILWCLDDDVPFVSDFALQCITCPC